MPLKLYDKAALVTAARIARKPVAFLVGSPLSNKDGKGVPTVSEMLNFVREEIKLIADSELPRFEAEIAGKAGSEVYQVAMDWVQGNLLQDTVNSIVSNAVLNARKPTSASQFDEDGSPEEWDIPSGIDQLASLVSQNREKFPGPILTTNFDPLISLAITARGRFPSLRVMSADGSLTNNVRQTGQIDVIHLHGFWRDSDTMHTPGQLTASRPRLKESLKYILQKHTLIVVAYGGWDDIFAQALAEAVQDSSSDINVLWCFYSSNALQIEESNKALFQRISPLLISGRFSAYGGIDCHTIFGEIWDALPVKTIATSISNDEIIEEESPLLGWQILNKTIVANLLPLTEDEVIRYFDGAVPTLRHAASHDIPRREKVKELNIALDKAYERKKVCSLQLIRAAGGEGKSTLLMQIAIDAANAGKWKVLWRTSAQEGLPLSSIEKLSTEYRWLIVVDNAENIISEIASAAEKLHERGQDHIHFLIASRDADWKNTRGDRKSWSQWLIKDNDCFLRSITSDDAKSVVKAWGKFGDKGLRGLKSAGKVPERALKLLNAIRDIDENQENKSWNLPVDGSFFGGLLKVRFGQNGLRAHVLDFLKRLQKVAIDDSNNGSTLLDALTYIAACHGTGITGIDDRVLADLVGVPRDWVNSRVILPLGAEAGAVDSGGQVFTRHSRVAAAVIVEAQQSLNLDFAEVWSRIVRQTAEAGLAPAFSSKSYLPILNAGPKLQRTLPEELSEESRKAIAIAAAKADVMAEPNKVQALTSLGKTYRNAQEYSLAISIFRDNFSATRSMEDYKLVRGYISEWGISESDCGREDSHMFAGAWLAGIALSDSFNPALITHEDVLVICSGIGVVFAKLAKHTQDSVYGKVVRASSFLGRLTKSDHRSERYFEKSDTFCDKMNIPYLHTKAEAIDFLSSGVQMVRSHLQDSFLSDMIDEQVISFEFLSSVLH